MKILYKELTSLVMAWIDVRGTMLILSKSALSFDCSGWPPPELTNGTPYIN
jgi:hypothetical protein